MTRMTRINIPSRDCGTEIWLIRASRVIRGQNLRESEIDQSLLTPAATNEQRGVIGASTMTTVQFAASRQSRKNGNRISILRWAGAIWLLALGWATCRRLTFGKYQIDAACPDRAVERKLRRSLRKSFRRGAKVTHN